MKEKKVSSFKIYWVELGVSYLYGHSSTTPTISRWSSLYAHFPPCDVGGVLCDVTWDCEHRDMGHVTAWHCPGPRSSPESRVSKIILVPEMDRQNVNTAGSLEIRLYRPSHFFSCLGSWNGWRKALHQREKSWIVLTTSYIFILTKY